MGHLLNDSAWRRGWQDTVRGWKSVLFIILEAILAPLLGFFVEWWWSIVAVASGMFCIWIGATASAPVKQRNEARDLLSIQPKPIPLSNRDGLIEAIVKLRQTAIELLKWQEQNDKVSLQGQSTLADMHTRKQVLSDNYTEAAKNSDIQMNIAGGVYTDIVFEYNSFLTLTVQVGLLSGKVINTDNTVKKLTYNKLIGEISARERDIKARINALAEGSPYPMQLASHKEGAQS